MACAFALSGMTFLRLTGPALGDLNTRTGKALGDLRARTGTRVLAKVRPRIGNWCGLNPVAVELGLKTTRGGVRDLIVSGREAAKMGLLLRSLEEPLSSGEGARRGKRPRPLMAVTAVLESSSARLKLEAGKTTEDEHEDTKWT